MHMKLGQGLFRRVFALEHSKTAYLADFALLYAAIAGLAAFLVVTGTRARGAEVAAFVLTGLGGWTLIEYLLHRFVLHGLQPFRRWHALHHRPGQPPGRDGVTTAFWDHVFRSTAQPQSRVPRP